MIAPSATGMEQQFSHLLKEETFIRKQEGRGFKQEDVFLATSVRPSVHDFENYLVKAMMEVNASVDEALITHSRTRVLLSTTKGNLSAGFANAIVQPMQWLYEKYKLQHAPLAVSNACASGVIAINTAADYISLNICDHVVVLGIDVVWDFVLYGFQSLYAVSAEPCKPYDKNRKGISLGEACAAVVLSNNASIFKQAPLLYLGGSSSNDANHISGPSRTGEGLCRSVNKTLQYAGVTANEIDYISAHGTATLFNDEMEAIAFNRLRMEAIPLNSFKGYYGHTLGAAGVLETALGMHCLRENMLIKNLGYHEQGTTVPLNIITAHEDKQIDLLLKTASGFGGCNASLLIKK